MNKLIILMISIMISFASVTFSQTLDFDCAFTSNSSSASGSIFGGSVKPNRTDSSGGVALPSDAYFPVLVVFVQFKGEVSDPRNSWPQDTSPTYLNNIIARDKNSTGDWWNFYNNTTQILSSHWAEISRGKFHVTSPTPTNVNTAFSVVLPYQASHYDSLGYPGGELQINKEIWISIKSQGLTDWRYFDRWKYNSSTGYFEFKQLGQSDGFVDMIYKVHKSRGVGGLVDYAGYNALSWYSTGTQFLVDTANNIKIDYGNDFTGSGITVSFRGQLAQYIGTVGHEHGHQLFASSGHSTYSRVSYGFGHDYFYSPADMILNNYMSPRNYTVNATNTLYDYSSRNSGSGEILKVPVQGNEYFLLVSRNKVSKWDRVMIGDTAQIDAYGDNSEYGKGLYIYHVPNGLNFPGGDISQQDMECADGLFEWEYAGQSANGVIFDCFLSGATDWYYYKKKKVSYENDSSNLFRFAPPSGYTSRGVGDGISFRNYLGIINNEHAYALKWWGEGEKPSNNCNIGIDRVFTNKKEINVNFDVGGDRWDAWKPGYNEVFSPYSSPNSNTWTTNPSNQNSGIFIWYYNYTGDSPPNLAYMKIYKAGSGGFSEDSILHLTPPSRPMNIVVDYYLETEDIMRPVITWNHNMEPDMLSDSLTKRYLIWRAIASSMASVPVNYFLLKTIDIDSGTAPVYIDTSIIAFGSVYPGTGEQMQYPVRYTVQAVDKYGDSSVRSDFGNAIGIINCGNACAYGEDNILQNEHSPKKYSMNQNFPNPFNPVTNIKYDLPKDNFVTIKIYDLLGRELMSLVNEYKKAGSYSVTFDAANYPSGVYYYKIKTGSHSGAGSFVQVRKMILIK